MVPSYAGEKQFPGVRKGILVFRQSTILHSLKVLNLPPREKVRKVLYQLTPREITPRTLKQGGKLVEKVYSTR